MAFARLNQQGEILRAVGIPPPLLARTIGDIQAVLQSFEQLQVAASAVGLGVRCLGPLGGRGAVPRPKGRATAPGRGPAGKGPPLFVHCVRLA